MKEKLIEAPLNGKDLCPDDIMEGLTNDNFIMHGGNAVGFIYNIPVIFKWADNNMTIHFESCQDMEDSVGKVKTELKTIMEADERKYIQENHIANVIWLSCFWKS